jgi:hypothetical protein
MADLHTVVEARLKAAQGAARDANERSRRRSATRLKEILRLPPSDRLSCFDDPALAPEDQAALRRSIKEELVRPKWRAHLRRSCVHGTRLMTRLFQPVLSLEIMLPAAAFAVWLAIAWGQSAHIAILTRTVPIRMLTDEGYWVDTALPSGRKIIVRLGWDGVYRLRHWIPGRGYETVPVPADAIEWAP